MTHATLRGFQHDPDADPTQYIFGASPIQAEILAPDRNWQPWLPAIEIQNRLGYDPLSCASYNTLTPLEILIRRKFGVERNYSDRFLAHVTDTYKRGGNDPHYVAEYLRRNGDVEEQEWPFLDVIDTFDKYYSVPPSLLHALARDFLKEWTIKHDTVRGTEAMWDALQYSPLGCSVGINHLDESGYWYKNGNAPDSHWTVIIGGEYGKYFLTFDSAEPVFKKLAWSKLNPQLVKRYAIDKTATTEQLGAFARFLQAILIWLNGPRIAPLPIAPSLAPNTPPPSLRLYEAAKSMLGKDASPQDLANDEVGCVESLQNVVHKAFGAFIEPYTLSTAKLLQNLRNDPDYVEVENPMTGDVAIFATQGKKIGHCGVWGKTHVMSNSSKSGKWEANYTHSEWLRAATKRGLPNTFFRRI